MQTASQILEQKGYDPSEQNDIVCVDNNSLDRQTREHFGIEEPIHLWECYYKGDADEEILLKIALEKGYEDIDALLLAMDSHLLKLAEAYPDQKRKK